MANHARLGQREAHEHTHGVEGDEERRRSAEQRHEPDSDRREQDDAPRVREAVAAERELARHVPVDREERRETREGVVGRVRGEEQDQHRRNEEDDVQDRACAVDRPADEGTRRMGAAYRRNDPIREGL